jgi:hypothetical protein
MEIHLRLAAELIGLRYENLMPSKAHGYLALSDIGAHRRLRDIDQRQLPAQTQPDPMGSVALLARSLAISFKNLVNESKSKFRFVQERRAPGWSADRGTI